MPRITVIIREQAASMRSFLFSFFVALSVVIFGMGARYKFNLENCCYELSINDVIALEENKIEAREKAKKDDQKQAVKAGEPHMCTVHLHE